MTTCPMTKKKNSVAKTNLPLLSFNLLIKLVISIRAMTSPTPIKIPIKLLIIACCVKNAATTSIKMKAIVITNENFLFKSPTSKILNTAKRCLNLSTTSIV